MTRTRCPHCGSAYPAWSKDALVAAAQAWAREHGRSPVPGDWNHAAPHHPNHKAVYRALGTWPAMIAAAGLEPSGRRRWTRAEIALAFTRWRFEHGRLPRAADWNRSGEWWPSRACVVDQFGSWTAGVVAAGYEPLRPRRSTISYQRQAAAQRRTRSASGVFA